MPVPQLPLGDLNLGDIMQQSQSAACDARDSWKSACICATNFLLGTFDVARGQDWKFGSPGRQPDSPAAIIGRWRLCRCSIPELSCMGTKGIFEICHCCTRKILCDDPRIFTDSGRLNPSTASMAWVPQKSVFWCYTANDTCHIIPKFAGLMF
jgi:hypothetical protein